MIGLDTRVRQGLLAMVFTLVFVFVAALPIPSAAVPIAPNSVMPNQIQVHPTAFGRPDLRDLPLGLRPIRERAVLPPSLAFIVIVAAAIAVAFGAGRYRTAAHGSPAGGAETSSPHIASHLPALGRSLDRQADHLRKLSQANLGSSSGLSDRHLSALHAEQSRAGQILENALDAAWVHTQSARGSCNLSEVLSDLGVNLSDSQGSHTETGPEISVPGEVLMAAFALLLDATPVGRRSQQQPCVVNGAEYKTSARPTVRVSLTSDASDDRIKICSDLLTPWMASLERGPDQRRKITLRLPYAEAAEVRRTHIKSWPRLQGGVA